MPTTITNTTMFGTNPLFTVPPEWADERELLKKHDLPLSRGSGALLTPDRWKELSAFQGSSYGLINQFHTRGSKLQAIDTAYKAFFKKINVKARDGTFRPLPPTDYQTEQRAVLSAIRTYLLAHEQMDREVMVFWNLYRGVKFFNGTSDPAARLAAWEATQPGMRKSVITLLTNAEINYSLGADLWEGATSVMTSAVSAFTDPDAAVFLDKSAEDVADESVGVAEAAYKASTELRAALQARAQSSTQTTFIQKLKKLLHMGIEKLKKKIREAITSMLDPLTVERVLKVMVGLAENIAKYVFKTAIPFLGSAAEVADSVWAAATKAMQAWDLKKARKAVRGATGSFVAIAQAMQDNLRYELADKALQVGKAGASLAMEIVSFGAAGVVKLAVTGIEWLGRIIYRLAKWHQIKAMQKEIIIVANSAINMSETELFDRMAVEAHIIDTTDMNPAKARYTEGYAPPFKAHQWAMASFLTNQRGSYDHMFKSLVGTAPYLAALVFASSYIDEDPGCVLHGATDRNGADLADAENLVSQCKQIASDILTGSGFSISWNESAVRGLLGPEDFTVMDRSMRRIRSLAT